MLTESGLPSHLAIYAYADITLTFSGCVTPLAAIWERDLRGGHRLNEMPGDWTRFWHLADQEYVQGGGWICVEEETGRLIVIDLDLPEPIYLVNSSVRNFYTTLAHFLEWSERSGGTTAETARFRHELRRQDTIPWEELEPFWINFIDATLEGDPRRVIITLLPETPGPGLSREYPGVT